jgi:hypothetical protein
VSDKNREAHCVALVHFKNMKNKFINDRLNGLTKPETIVAIAAVCGFWVSQFLAWNFVGTVLGALPKVTCILSFAALIFFFIVHVSNLWFRLPAILGLCSSAVLLSLFAYLSYFKASVMFIELWMLLSFGLAFVGVVLDAEQCWYLIANSGPPKQTLKSIRPSVMPSHHAEHAIHF